MLFRHAAALLCGAVLACAPLADAFATNKPVPGIDVIVKKYKPPKIVVQPKTDPMGQFTLKELAPGQYTIELDGKSLVAATAKAGATPEITVVLLRHDKTGAAKPMTFHGKATARGMTIDFTVPDNVGGAATYTGTVTAVK